MLEINFCTRCGYRIHRPLTVRRVPPQRLSQEPVHNVLVFLKCGSPGCLYFAVRPDFHRLGDAGFRGAPLNLTSITRTAPFTIYEIALIISTTSLIFGPFGVNGLKEMENRVNTISVIGSNDDVT